MTAFRSLTFRFVFRPDFSGPNRRAGLRLDKVSSVRYSAAMKKQPSSGAQTAGLAVAFLWGLTFLSIKVAVRELPPMTLALARFIIASALLPLIALVLKQSLAVRVRDLPLLAAGGFVGITLYFLCENNGIMLLSASEASIIVGTIPVVTLIAEVVVYRTRPGKRVWAGVILSFLGVSIMVLRSEGATTSPLGYVYMIGAALSWTLYSFLTKPLSGRYPLLALTFWQIFFGMIFCIPFAVAERPVLAMPSMPVVLNVLYLGVFGSAIGYWLYVVMLERLGAGRASVFINLIPVVSVIAAFIVLGERLGALQLVGGIAAVGGVYLATLSPRSVPK